MIIGLFEVTFLRYKLIQKTLTIAILCINAFVVSLSITAYYNEGNIIAFFDYLKSLPFWLTTGSTAFALAFDRLGHLNNGRQAVVRPPGFFALKIGEFLFSKKKYEKIYIPIVSDMREEYFEALSQNRIWKARWVRVRGTWSFFAAMGLDRFFSIVSLCVKVWKSVN